MIGRSRISLALNPGYAASGHVVPAVHALLDEGRQDADTHDNPRIKSGDGHDGGEMIRFHRNALQRADRHAI